MQPPAFGDKASRAQRTFSDTYAASVRTDAMDRFVDHLFSPNGRVSRQAYWLSTLVIFAVNLCTLYLMLRPWIALLTGTPVSALADDVGYLLLQNLVLFVISLLTAWFSIVVTIKRWHDLDKSGVWTFILFVPLVGPVWHLVMCGFVPGTAGPNRFGPDPR